MKNLYNKLKKTISFYLLTLSILFCLVGLVFKCIYLYEYKTLQDDITDAINDRQVYTYAYGSSWKGETIYGKYDFTDPSTYKKDQYTSEAAILDQLRTEGKGFCIYYNNVSNKILVVCLCCFCVFGYLCYIKLHPERKMKVIQMNNNSTNSYSYDKPVVECPYCHSTNTKKISGISKAGSVALFGVFAAGKVSKQWHCNNCNSDF